jgi:hypothetical protein
LLSTPGFNCNSSTSKPSPKFKCDNPPTIYIEQKFNIQ